jgi:hypothetical protein
MMLATVSTAMPAFGFAALVAAAAIGLFAGGVVLIGRRRLVPLAVILLALSVPAFGVSGVSGLLGLAIADCPPDAYECPF